MKPTFVKTPGGEELVMLPRADYEALREAAEVQGLAAMHEATVASLAGGAQETLSAAEVKAALAAPTPLLSRNWRSRSTCAWRIWSPITSNPPSSTTNGSCRRASWVGGSAARAHLIRRPLTVLTER